MDSIPVPARDLVTDPSLYPAEIMGCMIASRGCPFRCAFCDAHTIWTRRARFRSAKQVADEIERVKNEYGTTHFDFWDDSFTASRARAAALCDEIIARRLRITWYCSTRADLLDNDLLKLMKSAGCDTIALGIESGSNRMLEIVRKDITIEKCIEAIRLIRRNGIHVTVFLMMGFPEETEDDMRRTMEFAARVKGVRTIRATVFTPYPGSELYDAAAGMGLVPPKIEWAEFDHQSPENHFVKNVGRDRFRELVNEMAGIVDRHNSSRMVRLENAFCRAPYLSKHPGVVLRWMARKMKRGNLKEEK